MTKQTLIAKTFAGLEELLAKELEAIGAEHVEIGNRMVTFEGDKEMLYRANFCLRTAVKVLRPIRQFKASDPDQVYEEVKKIEWSDYMDADQTFIVDAVVFSDEFRHSRFAAYRVKDAIADYFREKTGRRPNVGISNPDLRVNLHISEHDVTISLDSSGESLHHRGYRVGTVAAPLNEVLAAAIIMLTGWDGQSDLIDPMCGSGTILIEAALIARNIYPGVFRKEFAFERWKDFDPELFEKIYNDDSQEREFHHHIYGYDINRHAVSIAQENAKSAGVSDIVSISQQDFRDFEQPAEPAIIVTNPPYGERITTDDILGLYEDIGRTLKHSFVGGDAWILSLHEECFARIGFRPSTRIILYNGALECELRKYQVFEGKLRERREEGLDIKTTEERERNRKFKGRKSERMEREASDAGAGTDGDDDSIDHLLEPIPHINRHNYKWGDRDNRFRDNDDSHYFKSRPFDSKPQYGNKSKAEDNKEGYRRRKEGAKPRTEGFKPRTEGFKPRSEGFKPRTEGFKPRSEGFKPRSEGMKPRSEGMKPRRNGDRPSGFRSRRNDD
ncbi:MAG: methyltransferase [Bacteroidaceae bacterium]|nr:methyltransferase [Bacteroidaceae bacterium]